MELIEQIKEDLKIALSERRYIHSLGVMDMSIELARIYNIDQEKAAIAGLLHDIAKEMSLEEYFKYAEENNIEIDEIERINTKVLHGKIGADIAKKKYGIDEQIKKAIEFHTTTSPEMDTLAKIVYVADKIELSRKDEDYDIEYERKLAKKDLDETVLYIIDSNLKSLISKGKLIQAKVMNTRNKIILNKSKK